MIKCIGFDATEGRRAKTFGGTGKLKICPAKGLPVFHERYDVRYFLREWGWDRARCLEEIRSAGLPDPCKSACFYCPASSQSEVQQLFQDEPDLYRLARYMEQGYRNGPHYRGEVYTITAKHKLTGEKLAMEFAATTPADARNQFRTFAKDTAKPYQWQLDASAAVQGLGRQWTWQDVPVTNLQPFAA